MTIATREPMTANGAATLSERTGLDELLRFLAHHPHPVVHELADEQDEEASRSSLVPLLHED